MRHFCTYFDHRYLATGLALQESLSRHAKDATLWVLCLSEECEAFLEEAKVRGVRTLSLKELELADPGLAAVRGTRSSVEYYFTCSPCLPRHLLNVHPEIDAITYVDADLYFFSDPACIFDEIGDASIAITPHRFAAGRADLVRYGQFNVGWLTFKRDTAALACLEWWRARCIEWCFDRVEPGRFADQKYLDQFPVLFPGVHVIEHPGANLAPWNVASSPVSADDARAMVDASPLLFFHFQGLRKLSSGTYDTNLDDYGTSLTAELRELVYVPYLKALAKAEGLIRESRAHPPSEPHLRRSKGGLFGGMIDHMVTRIRAEISGSIIRI